jgi:hypothetical protein
VDNLDVAMVNAVQISPATIVKKEETSTRKCGISYSTTMLNLIFNVPNVKLMVPLMHPNISS